METLDKEGLVSLLNYIMETIRPPTKYRYGDSTDVYGDVMTEFVGFSRQIQHRTNLGLIEQKLRFSHDFQKRINDYISEYKSRFIKDGRDSAGIDKATLVYGINQLISKNPEHIEATMSSTDLVPYDQVLDDGNIPIMSESVHM